MFFEKSLVKIFGFWNETIFWNLEPKKFFNSLLLANCFCRCSLTRTGREFTALCLCVVPCAVESIINRGWAGTCSASWLGTSSTRLITCCPRWPQTETTINYKGSTIGIKLPLLHNWWLPNRELSSFSKLKSRTAHVLFSIRDNWYYFVKWSCS